MSNAAESCDILEINLSICIIRAFCIIILMIQKVIIFKSASN